MKTTRPFLVLVLASMLNLKPPLSAAENQTSKTSFCEEGWSQCNERMIEAKLTEAETSIAEILSEIDLAKSESEDALYSETMPLKFTAEYTTRLEESETREAQAKAMWGWNKTSTLRKKVLKAEAESRAIEGKLKEAKILLDQARIRNWTCIAKEASLMARLNEARATKAEAEGQDTKDLRAQARAHRTEARVKELVSKVMAAKLAPKTSKTQAKLKAAKAKLKAAKLKEAKVHTELWKTRTEAAEVQLKAAETKLKAAETKFATDASEASVAWWHVMETTSKFRNVEHMIGVAKTKINSAKAKASLSLAHAGTEKGAKLAVTAQSERTSGKAELRDAKARLKAAADELKIAQSKSTSAHEKSRVSTSDENDARLELLSARSKLVEAKDYERSWREALLRLQDK